MAASKVPGVQCVVISGGRIAYRSALGVRSVETGDSVRTEDLFRLGSTAKMTRGRGGRGPRHPELDAPSESPNSIPCARL
jgi:hypothetical protein